MYKKIYYRDLLFTLLSMLFPGIINSILDGRGLLSKDVLSNFPSAWSNDS
jgi:hypothetical protein